MADKLKTLPPNCIQCKIKTRVSPGKYWMCFHPNENPKCQIELYELEARLNDSFVKEELVQPEREKIVAVLDNIGRWRRGKIEHTFNIGLKKLYKVFLIDHGEYVKVGKDNIKLLPENLAKIPPFSFLVILKGLIPCTEILDPVDRVNKRQICTDWTEESIEYTDNFLKKYKDVFVLFKKGDGRIYYCDVYLSNNQQIRSLRDELLAKNFAFYNSNYFDKTQHLQLTKTISNADQEADIDMETNKYEYVKKWLNDAFMSNVLDVNGEMSTTDTSTLTSNSLYSSPLSDEKNKVVLAQTSPSSSSSSYHSLDFEEKMPLVKQGQRYSDKPRDRTRLEGNNCLATTVAEKSGGTQDVIKPATNPVDEQITCNDKKPSLKRTAEENNVERVEEKRISFRDLIKNRNKKEGKNLTIVPSVNVTTKEKNHRRHNHQESSTNEGEEKRKARSKLCDVIAKVDKSYVKDIKTLRDNDLNSVKSLKMLEKGQHLPDNDEWFFNERLNMKMSHFSKVLVRGEMASLLKPITNVRDLRVITKITESLVKANCKTLSKIQSYAIPAIQRSSNVVMISKRCTGKTLSYVIPLLNFLHDESLFNNLSPGNGPLAIILCSSSKNAQFVYDVCHCLLGIRCVYEKNLAKIKMSVVYGGKVELKMKVSLTNGCDLLISTPYCLNRLLQEKYVTNMERLHFLVLDDADVLLNETFIKQTKRILKCSGDKQNERRVQYIVAGERYTQEIVHLHQHVVTDPLLLIASHLESAVFARLRPVYHIIDKADKPQFLLGKIQPAVGKFKIVVVCETSDEVKYLMKFLNHAGLTPITACEDMEKDQLKRAEMSWYKHSTPLLLCTDDVIQELEITDSQWLVHYSLPRKSMTQFGFRFSALEDGYRKCLSKDEEGLEKSNQTVVILIDDENHVQLPRVIEFVRRLGCKVRPEVQAKCEEIRRCMEREKDDKLLCPQLLKFGKCYDMKDLCQYRHIITSELDSPTRGLPTSGTVKLVLTHVHDATHFSARILEHTDCNNVVNQCPNALLNIYMAMQKYYKEDGNRRFHGTPKINDVCACTLIKHEKASEDYEEYYRCRVIEVTEVDKYEQPVKVKVKLLDQGQVVVRKKNDLLELPEGLKSHPDQTIDVYTCNLLPCDYDQHWSEFTKRDISKLVNENSENLSAEEQYWEGKIVFALGSSLWLEPLRFYKYLSNIELPVVEHCLRLKLLKDNMAVLHQNHLTPLYRLAKLADIELPDYTKEQFGCKIAKIVKPQWAHFFNEELVKVFFSSAESLSLVFLVDCDREKLLKDLNKDCQMRAVKMLSSENKLMIKVGTTCLASTDDNGKLIWNRAVITNVVNEDDIQIFFVDFGNFAVTTAKDLLPLPRDLLAKLPFQAVECCLVGVDENPDVQKDKILDFVYEFSEEGNLELYAHVCKKDNEALVTGGRRYHVNLLKPDGTSLNKLLIEQGMAVGNENDKEYLDKTVNIPQHTEPEPDVLDVPDVKVDASSKHYFEQMLRDLDDEMFNEIVEGDFYEQLLPDSVQKLFKNLVKEINEPAKVEIKKNCLSKMRTLMSGKSKTKTEADLGVAVVVHPAPAVVAQTEPALQLPPRLCSANSNHFTPKVEWSQSGSVVKLIVDTPDVKFYDVYSDTNVLIYWGKSCDRLFSLNCNLFGCVNHCKTELEVKGLHVVIKLYKLTNSHWPRLLDTNVKNPLIVHSLNNIEGEFDDDETDPVVFQNFSATMSKLVQNHISKELDDEDNSNDEDSDC